MTEGVYVLPDELAARTRPRVKAVVLAGGKGTRLAPYTSVLPKPLMPIGDRSILELVIGQLNECGITDVTLSVGYLSHLIEAVLDNRPDDGVNIRYVHEEEPLGTAAPLRLLDRHGPGGQAGTSSRIENYLGFPTGVSGTELTRRALTQAERLYSSDVLTTLDYTQLIRHHRRHRNLLTIATRMRPVQIDYGVLHLGSNGRSNRVEAYVEKPKMTSTVSMGIYVLEPRALSFIPREGYFDFPDLVQALLKADERVGAYRYEGMWFDIGRRDDYESAVSAWIEENEPEAPASKVATRTA